MEQRLGQLDQLYTPLRADVYDRRMFGLKVVVVFIAADLLLVLEP